MQDIFDLDKVTKLEFAKYDPKTGRSTKPVTLLSGKHLSSLLQFAFNDGELTEDYYEDPELPRYYADIELEDDTKLQLKVVHNFVNIAGSYFYSPSKSLWNKFDELSDSRSLLRKFFGVGKHEPHWEGVPSFRNSGS